MAKYLGYRPQNQSSPSGSADAPDFKAIWNLEKYNDLLLGNDWLSEELKPVWQTPADLGGAAEQSAYSNTVIAVDPLGRDVIITYSNTTNLPDGLTLNSSTGEISGTFTTNRSFTEVANVTIRATSASNNYSEKTFSISEIVVPEAAGFTTLPTAGPVYTPEGWTNASILIQGGSITSPIARAGETAAINIYGIQDVTLKTGVFGMFGNNTINGPAAALSISQGANGYGIESGTLGNTNLIIAAGGAGGIGYRSIPGPYQPGTPATRAGASGGPGSSGAYWGGGGGGGATDGSFSGGGRGGARSTPNGGWPGEPGGSTPTTTTPVPQNAIGNPAVTAVWVSIPNMDSNNGPAAPGTTLVGWGKISWG